MSRSLAASGGWEWALGAGKAVDARIGREGPQPRHAERPTARRASQDGEAGGPGVRVTVAYLSLRALGGVRGGRRTIGGVQQEAILADPVGNRGAGT